MIVTKPNSVVCIECGRLLCVGEAYEDCAECGQPLCASDDCRDRHPYRDELDRLLKHEQPQRGHDAAGKGQG